MSNHCKKCGHEIYTDVEKALSGEIQLVWRSSYSNEWACADDGNEHEPGEVTMVERKFEVEVTVEVVLTLPSVLAQDEAEEEAFEAVDLLMQEAHDGSATENWHYSIPEGVVTELTGSVHDPAFRNQVKGENPHFIIDLAGYCAICETTPCQKLKS